VEKYSAKPKHAQAIKLQEFETQLFCFDNTLQQNNLKSQAVWAVEKY
jgi:hypothetical protein